MTKSVSHKAAIATGHEVTTEAAEQILREGGNAFDAVLGAYFAACVAEPVLSALMGGGFLMAHPQQQKPRLYDFFAHTPRSKELQGTLDFRPKLVDFGSVQQEFHIGLGAVAAPGCMPGVTAILADLCSMPLREIVQPAIAAARSGVRINPLQAYLFQIIAPIFLDTSAAIAIYASPTASGKIIQTDEVLLQPDLADTLELLGHEGTDLFVRGEIAQLTAQQCTNGGGYLDYQDFTAYEVQLRAPLQIDYRDARIWTNPPPSSGGLLMAFGLDLLQQHAAATGWGERQALLTLAAVLDCTTRARIESRLSVEDPRPDPKKILSPALLQRYRDELSNVVKSYAGTTHFSVIDGDGNAAAMTVSNGEGCGSIVPGTGIMLNNMLGEEDLNPCGFHTWPVNQRMSSMMSPTLMQRADGTACALGSGGSNRIRTTLLQVIRNLVDYPLSLEEVVRAPRLHLDDETLYIEGGFEPAALALLLEHYPQQQTFASRNLFFGGAHCVRAGPAGVEACGDPRRGGNAMVLP